MTFEKFVLSWTWRDIAYHENAGTTGIGFAREAWNAAIDAADNSLYNSTDKIDGAAYQAAATMLRALKTPLEAPETQKVGDTMPSYDWEASRWVVVK